MRYPVVLHTDDGKSYGVTVPDVAGCFSGGNDIDDALENIKEALGLHFNGLLEDGELIPLATNIRKHQNNPNYAGGTWAYIDFDITPYLGAQVRFNASLPEGLLKRIDLAVENNRDKYRTRSNFLKEAALHELEKAN